MAIGSTLSRARVWWGQQTTKEQRRQTKTLAQLMEAVARTLHIVCADEPLCVPLLHIIADDRSDVVCALGMPAQVSVTAARLFIAQHDARLAIVAAEVEMAASSLDDADEDLCALARGETTVRELPVHKREHGLLLYGEDREGHDALRLWRIVPHVRGGTVSQSERSFVEVTDATLDTVELPAPYRPLFMLRWCEQEGLSLQQARRDLKSNAHSKLNVPIVELD